MRQALCLACRFVHSQCLSRGLPDLARTPKTTFRNTPAAADSFRRCPLQALACLARFGLAVVQRRSHLVQPAMNVSAERQLALDRVAEIRRMTHLGPKPVKEYARQLFNAGTLTRDQFYDERGGGRTYVLDVLLGNILRAEGHTDIPHKYTTRLGKRGPAQDEPEQLVT